MLGGTGSERQDDHGDRSGPIREPSGRRRRHRLSGVAPGTATVGAVATSGVTPAAGGRRPRLLIPLTILFAVRYAIRTGLADRLRDHAELVFALSWDDPDLVAELEALGHQAVRLPEPVIAPDVLRLFQRLDAHFQRRLASPSTGIDRRRNELMRPPVRRARIVFDRTLLRTASWRPGDEARREAELRRLLPHASNLQDHLDLLADHHIDALFSVTPFTAQERLLLMAAEHACLPRVTSILSFDNVTTRPPLPVTFDRYLVWNRFNRSEVLRSYRGARPDQVAVTGPAQFDFYVDPGRVSDRDRWRAGLGLGDGPTVLYGAGAAAVVRHETQYVDDLCAGIADGRLPADLRIVLRRHPVDPPGRWDRFGHDPRVVFDEPGAIGRDQVRPGQVDLGDAEIDGLCSTLAHTDVHVNASSTLTLDGAFYDKPQIGPAYDRRGSRGSARMAADLYRREHYLPIVASGGLELAHSPAQLVDRVRSALIEPARLARERRRMLEQLVTFTDGHCTERVASEVCKLLRSIAPRAPDPSGVPDS